MRKIKGENVMNTLNQLKPKMKLRKKILIIFAIIAVVIAVCMLTGAILHTTYFKGKLEKINPYGQLVNVYDGKMHVFTMGNGKNTVVLLPGMGIPLPSADFGPLLRKLSENYTVVIVEYFGMGFSSNTARPRNCENYVEEIRTVLRQTGFKPPYVLMPHSISGVYSEYYASKYPEEVKSIISLDGTPTVIYAEMPAFVKYVLPIAKFQQAIGVTSLLGSLAVNKKELLSFGYTEKEINDVITFVGFSINDIVIEQILSSSEFIKQTMNLPFPKTIPYFKIISKQTYETPNNQIKMTPQEFQHKHLERIGEHAKYKILNGTHFIYLNNVNRIAEIIDNLLIKAN